MRLAVTRPEPDLERTARRLEGMGHQVIRASMLRLAILPEPPLPEAIEALALTSRNGVRAIANWPAAMRWRDIPLFAVGKATAAAAREAGFTDVRASHGTGAELAKTMIATLAAGAPILYPTAEERHPDFEAAMREAGFDIGAVEAYRMDEAESLSTELGNELREGTLEGVLLYSERTAMAFSRLVREAGLSGNLAGVSLFVISPSVARATAGLKPAAIHVAASPDEDHLMQLIGAASASS